MIAHLVISGSIIELNDPCEKLQISFQISWLKLNHHVLTYTKICQSALANDDTNANATMLHLYSSTSAEHDERYITQYFNRLYGYSLITVDKKYSNKFQYHEL